MFIVSVIIWALVSILFVNVHWAFIMFLPIHMRFCEVTSWASHQHFTVHADVVVFFWHHALSVWGGNTIVCTEKNITIHIKKVSGPPTRDFLRNKGGQHRGSGSGLTTKRLYNFFFSLFLFLFSLSLTVLSSFSSVSVSIFLMQYRVLLALGWINSGWCGQRRADVLLYTYLISSNSSSTIV